MGNVPRRLMAGFFAVACLTGGVCGTDVRAEEIAWKTIASEHFIINYRDDDRFAKDVLDKAEEYYRSIASALGYPRYSEFWLWNNRVKIFIYPSHESYLESTGQPSWSQGAALYEEKQISSYAWNSDFPESLLPHEIAHLVFRDFVGFKGEVPRWLDEGVAQWAEEDTRQAKRALVRKKFREDALLLIEDMMKLNLDRISGKERVFIKPAKTKDGGDGVLFLDTGELVNAYYLQGFSLVDFLMQRYGADDFTFFCRQLRDGKSLDEALRFAYPSYIRSLPELEEKWRKYLEEMDVAQ